MKAMLPIYLTLSLMAAADTSRATPPADAHKGHHPPQAATAQPAPAVAKTHVAQQPPEAAANAPKAKAETQLQRMRDMHAQWMKASPAERERLMAEQMTVMRDGMKMMHEMSASAMPMEGAGGAMPAKGPADGDKAGMHDQMGQTMKARHDAMHQHMQMMEEMMQLMMDRLADPPAKH